MKELEALRQKMLKELQDIGAKDAFGHCDLHDSADLIQSLNGLEKLCPCGPKEQAAERHAQHLTADQAKKWVSSMQNADGTTGSHWSYEQAVQLMSQRSIACNPVDFWAALNMMYSDYYRVARAYSADTPNFYADMAAAFLNDDDSVDGKLVEYRDHVSKH